MNLRRNCLLCLLISLIFVFTGCAGSSSESSKTDGADLKKKEFVQTSDAKTLIAYFTWADNTVVKDKDAALRSAISHYESVGDNGNYDDVDAIASASLVKPGNAERIAGWIQEQIGGDLFSIQVKEPYPSDYDECMDRASDELAEKTYPKLKSKIEDISQYDTVFLGYPNWWSGCPMAVQSFIKEHDLSGKKIVLFCTHGTGGVARSGEDIREILPKNCQIEKNILGVYRSEILNSKDKVLNWLSKIGYEKAKEEKEVKRSISIETEEGEKLMFELNDSSAADSLYNQLPMTVEVEDFSTNEKIFYPSQKLNLKNTPKAKMKTGTLAYYEPWGNVVMFYDTYSPNGDLYELGKTVSKVNRIKSLSGKITINKEER